MLADSQHQFLWFSAPCSLGTLINSKRDSFDHPLWMRVGFGIVVVIMFTLALLTAQDLFSQIVAWL